MRRKLKPYSLGLCLFVFLFVIIGGGLHLGAGGALLAAVSGTPLVIFAYNRLYSSRPEGEELPKENSASPRLELRSRL
jgi:hypothetical protein